MRCTLSLVPHRHLQFNNLHELCHSPAHLLHHLPITSGVVAVHYLLTAIKTEPVAQISRRNPSQLRQPHNQSKLPYCLIFGSLLSVACGWRCAPPPTTYHVTSVSCKPTHVHASLRQLRTSAYRGLLDIIIEPATCACVGPASLTSL